MRRLASVFASKRDKAGSNDQSASNSRSQASLLSIRSKSIKRSNSHVNSPPVTPSPLPPTPQLSVSDPTPSSDSSSGSASLQTPEDDHHIRLHSKKSWVSWLGSKRSATVRSNRRPDDWEPKLMPEWQPRPAPILDPPPSGNRVAIQIQDTDDDTSSESEEDSASVAHNVLPLPAPNLPVTPATVALACQNLQSLTSSRLVPSTSASPFTRHPNSPLFPRSCNPSRLLRPSDSLRSTMHRTHLLHRLKHSAELSHADSVTILPFSSRAPVVPPPTKVSQFDEPAISDSLLVKSSSLGITQWISRPCFEDRFIVWILVNDSVVRQYVTGTTFGVAALEFSEALEAMASGLQDDFDPIAQLDVVQRASEQNGTLQVPSVAAIDAQSPGPSHGRNSPYIAVPSPLRMQFGVAFTSPSGSAADGLTSVANINPEQTVTTAAPTLAAKRGVRFAEDDKDEQIPLGYVLRMRKRKEEKARFLREEQERRAFEEEKAKLEEERRRRDAERREWEQERKAWEKEKKAMEEERKQRLYAEEVAAARTRREAQRAGSIPGGSGGGIFGTSNSSTSLREVERNRARDAAKYTRPLYDSSQNSRRQASDSAVPTIRTSPMSSSSNSPHSGSPSNSRPESIAGHSPISTGSRPASVYSTQTISSSEDAYLRESGVRNGKRNSIASLSSARPYSTNSLSASNQSLQYVPPVPQLPPFAMDMPLLPPAPPFMTQQYPRPRSHHSSSSRTPSTPSSPSHSPSRQRIPSNNSSERINMPPQPPQQHRRSTYSPSSSSPHRPESHPQHRSNPSLPRRPEQHQRRSTGETTASSSMSPHPMSPGSHQGQDRAHSHPSSYSQSYSSSMARGRPALPMSSTMTHTMTPNPWTAPPTQNSIPPNAMPTYVGVNMTGGSQRPPPNRRQTVIS